MSQSDYLFSNRYYRRILLASGLLALFALLIIRFFLVPYFSGQQIEDSSYIISAVVDNLFIALVSSLLISVLIFWLLPISSEASNAIVVEPASLKSVLKESIADTNYFLYSGHTARWTCAVTLPYLASEAATRDTTIQIHLTILDPEDKQACNRYAILRNRIGVEKKAPAALMQKHRLELLSTIVSVYAWKVQEPRLDLEIGLSNNVSIFRVDLSAQSAVVTTPGIRKPALLFPSESPFYNLFREDVISLHEQSRILPDVDGTALEQLDVANTRKLLKELGLEVSSFSDDDMKEIATLAHTANNPYLN